MHLHEKMHRETRHAPLYQSFVTLALVTLARNFSTRREVVEQFQNLYVQKTRYVVTL